MMMMMRRVMCVLAVVLCSTCGYTMTAAAVEEPPIVKPNSDDVGRIGNGEVPDVKFEEHKKATYREYCGKNPFVTFEGKTCKEWGFINNTAPLSPKDKRPEGRDPPVAAAAEGALGHKGGRSVEGQVSVDEPQGGLSEDPGSSTEAGQQKPDTHSTTPQSQTQGTNGAADGDQGTQSNTADNTTPGDSALTQQPSPPAVDTTVTSDSQETNSTTPPSTENTTKEAPTTTPSPVPNAEISSIALTVQNTANVVDSSVSSVWVRVPPLLIVVTLACILVC